ncbi:MAG: PIG-L deacetylase family protein [Steroidobacteraceae bacterium]
MSRLFIAALACAFLTQCRSPSVTASSARSAPVLLAIFAHPDDEASVSAVLAKYAATGARVHLAIATDGRLGVNAHAGIPAGDELAAVRARESQCAAEKLGIEAPVLFGLHDQMKMGEGLARYGEQVVELRKRVTQLFAELQPDAVITWGPSGWTGHPDHRMVSAVVTEVFQSRQWERPRQLFYPAVPTGKVPANNPFQLATVDPRFLPVRVSVSTQDYEKAKTSWLCHQSQYTAEQIEQMHQSRIDSLAGTTYFQPVVPATRKSDSLFR